MSVWLMGWAQPVELLVQPLFGNRPSINGALPLLIEVRNRSGNLRGVVSVAQEGFSYQREYRYPLELPAGGRKRLIACPIVGGFGSFNIVVRFSAPGVSVEAQQPLSPIGEEDRLVVGVGDAIGGMQFLRTIKIRPRVSVMRPYPYSSYQREGTYEVAYCRSELFPPMAIACSGVSVIVLGAGAERMSAEQWQALLNWVRLGGTLIAPGGAGALYLQHPALQPLLPVQVQGLGELDSLRAVGAFCGQEPPAGRVSITLSRPAPDSAVLLQQNGVPLIATRSYGLGAIVFLAFSPWDQPMRSYGGNPAFWQALLQRVPDLPPSYYLTTLFRMQTGSDPNNWYYYGYGTPYRPPPSSSRFQVRLPSVELILGLLLVYFVLVVPVNYWVLRRLRALDWSWLTVPVIAVLFVLLLSRLAGDLYRKPLSGEIKTVLLMNAGDTGGYTVNSVQLFFPKAGVYDFRFDQCDLVEWGQQDQSFSVVGAPTRVSTVEIEPKRVEGYRVRSLSLQWFRYTRPVQLTGSVQSSLRVRRESGMLHLIGTIQNRLPYDLQRVELLIGGQSLPLGNLKAGGTLKVDQWVEPPGMPSRPRRRNVYPPGYPYPPEEPMLPALPEIARQLRAHWGGQLPCVLLTARANQPVLAPELGSAFESAAEVTYLVALPLRGE